MRSAGTAAIVKFPLRKLAGLRKFFPRKTCTKPASCGMLSGVWAAAPRSRRLAQRLPAAFLWPLRGIPPCQRPRHGILDQLRQIARRFAG